MSGRKDGYACAAVCVPPPADMPAFELLEINIMTNTSIDARPETVHWGYLSAAIPPVARIASGDSVTSARLIAGTPRPSFWWTLKEDDGIRVKTRTPPKEVRLWQATNPEARDFRLDTIGKAYTSTVLEDLGGGVYLGEVEKPEKGWTAFFVELTYDGGGTHPMKFTTEVRVVPDVLPFAHKDPAQGTLPPRE